MHQKRIFYLLFSVFTIIISSTTYADTYYLSLKDAEHRALGTNNILKAATAQANASDEMAGAAFAPLVPSITIGGKYQYNTHIPVFTFPITLPGIEQDQFEVGVRTPYQFNATINYTIWDNFSNINVYKSARLLANSQTEIKENTKLELLLQTRLAYLLVQLSIQELKSIEDSLKVVRAQFRDIDNAYKAGAVAKLDWNDAQRNIYSYELEYEKARADVELKVKDLYALLTLPTTVEVFSSQKISDESVELDKDFKIHFDKLDDSLKRATQWEIETPPDSQPKLRSQRLLAQSYEAQADSEFAKLFPKIDVFATAQLLYPDVIQLKLINQNSYGVSASMPIFDGLNILHKVAASKQNAMMAQFNHDQARIDLDRDYEKNIELLQNLKIQKEINIKDIAAAKESAKLYFESYKAGQSLLINVQRANLQVLTSEVQGARIKAEMLQQLYQLQYLSGSVNL